MTSTTKRMLIRVVCANRDGTLMSHGVDSTNVIGDRPSKRGANLEDGSVISQGALAYAYFRYKWSCQWGNRHTESVRTESRPTNMGWGQRLAVRCWDIGRESSLHEIAESCNSEHLRCIDCANHTVRLHRAKEKRLNLITSHFWPVGPNRSDHGPIRRAQQS